MLRLLTLVSLLAAALIAVACDPYSPDLGATPYRCGTSEPKCPDGYDAVTVSQPVLCECHLHGGQAPDAGNMSCSDNNTEPNDTFATARMTPVGAGASNADFPAQAICSVMDVDNFKVNCTQVNQKLTATLQFNASGGNLNVRILDDVGERLDMAPMMMGNALVTSAKLPKLGTFYVQVGSAAGTNTYDLSLTLQ